jgi:hypothetical protein
MGSILIAVDYTFSLLFLEVDLKFVPGLAGLGWDAIESGTLILLDYILS